MDLAYTATALRQLRKIPAKRRDAMTARLRTIAEDLTAAIEAAHEEGRDADACRPDDNNVTAVRGVADGYRLRSSDYRALFNLNFTSDVMEVYTIGHRGEVYR